MGIKFVGVKKDASGNIVEVLTNENQVLTIEEAIQKVHEGVVDSLTDLHKDGTWEIDLPTSHEAGSNLDDLPEF